MLSGLNGTAPQQSLLGRGPRRSGNRWRWYTARVLDQRMDRTVGQRRLAPSRFDTTACHRLQVTQIAVDQRQVLAEAEPHLGQVCHSRRLSVRQGSLIRSINRRERTYYFIVVARDGWVGPKRVAQHLPNPRGVVEPRHRWMDLLVIQYGADVILSGLQYQFV